MTSPRRTSFPGLQGMLDRRRALLIKLVAARQDSGLSQTAIAARMGTSQSAVARLERGDADVRLSTFDRYAAAVGRTVDWQIHEEAHQHLANACQRPSCGPRWWPSKSPRPSG